MSVQSSCPKPTPLGGGPRWGPCPCSPEFEPEMGAGPPSTLATALVSARGISGTLPAILLGITGRGPPAVHSLLLSSSASPYPAQGPKDTSATCLHRCAPRAGIWLGPQVGRPHSALLTHLAGGSKPFSCHVIVFYKGLWELRTFCSLNFYTGKKSKNHTKSIYEQLEKKVQLYCCMA